MNASLYDQAIKALAQAAHGHGRLADASAGARRDNPLCGDRIAIELRIDGGRIAALAHEVRGCLLCRAAASIIGLHACGAAPAEVRANARALAALLAGEAGAAPSWPELAAFAPVAAHRSRHGCVMLPFEALEDALGGGAGSQPTGG